MSLKKNYLDNTAVFLYQLGVSLIHVALLVGSLVVELPDVEVAKTMDKAYLQNQMDL